MHVLCQWCKIGRIPWWSPRILCAVCRELRATFDREIEQRHADAIADSAKHRIWLDGRYDDEIPGVPHKRHYTRDYVGPERRKVQGSLFDRKGYIRDANYHPDSKERRRDRRSNPDRGNSDTGTS